MKLTDSRCMVIKIGSALLVDDKTQTINQAWLESLVADIAMLTQLGIQIVIVSSGAIAFGKLALNITPNKLSVDKKQAISAVGQIQLMYTYQNLLNQCGIKAAQVLLTLEDSEHRGRYINVRNTMHNLLQMKVIPIVNENDTVATSEIRYGDNDRLAARVAQMVEADTLVLLSDIDGFYTDDPRKNAKATLIPEVKELTPEILAMGQESSTHHGSGGMITKLSAAKIAMNSGCRMLITAGRQLHPLQHFMDCNHGTWFLPKTNPHNAMRTWLREHLNPHGEITIDEGAAKALKKGASLLPVGIVNVNGHFDKGATIKIVSTNQEEIARGLSNYCSHDILQIIGQPSDKLENILGYNGCHEVIHRDNMALV